jgi:4-diphosphocytidyl-2-C-methyl-D-erythritol kinase
VKGPEVRVSSPAKVNLSLGVGPRREDGYHALATVYHAIGLFDEVVLRPAEENTVTVSGDAVDVDAVPTDADNLVLRAVRLLGEHHGEPLSVAAHVHKRIPVAGGLAGGSTDAAAALVGADALFELHTPKSELVELASELGSDVPFCMLGGTALGSGRGERVAPIMTRGQYWWVVVPGAGGLSTPEVYAQLDQLRDGQVTHSPDVPDELLAALAAGDPHRLGVVMSNDLEPAAISMRPELAGLLDAGRDASACGALVSGSGPTTVFLCEGPDHAEQVRSLLGAVPGGAVAQITYGPAHGTRVTSLHS